MSKKARSEMMRNIKACSAGGEIEMGEDPAEEAAETPEQEAAEQGEENRGFPGVVTGPKRKKKKKKHKKKAHLDTGGSEY